jgi:hypothetical protein
MFVILAALDLTFERAAVGLCVLVQIAQTGELFAAMRAYLRDHGDKAGPGPGLGKG